jgi:hypothetical protein
MGYEFAYEAQEALHVREMRMGVEGHLVNPLGVNKEGQRIAGGLVEMDTNATRLGSRGLQNQYQLVVKLLPLFRYRLKANKNVKRQDGPLGREYTSAHSREKSNPAALATRRDHKFA